MGKKVILFDDIDGTEGAQVETRTFSIGGQDYEIDLREDNYLELLRSVEVFTAVARKVESKPAPRRRRAKSDAAKEEAAPPEEVPEEILAEIVPPREPVVEGVAVTPAEALDADIRKWARAQGWKVGERGRLPQEVIQEYREYARKNRPTLAAVNGAHVERI